jgi:hypothetical protein
MEGRVTHVTTRVVMAYLGDCFVFLSLSLSRSRSLYLLLLICLFFEFLGGAVEMHGFEHARFRWCSKMARLIVG